MGQRCAIQAFATLKIKGLINKIYKKKYGLKVYFLTQKKVNISTDKKGRYAFETDLLKKNNK